MLVKTERLRLVAATLELALLEVQSVSALVNALGCSAPESWPPPLNDAQSQRWYLDMLTADPTVVGWGLWYIVRNVADGGSDLIGNGGLKGKPENGVCEIGYSLLPPHQGHGYATEAARALLVWAFDHPEVDRVTAETLPELTPSIRVMEKCGMQFVGAGKAEEGQETVRYEITRATFDRR